MTKERQIEVKLWIKCPLLRLTKEVSIENCRSCHYARVVDFIKMKVSCAFPEKKEQYEKIGD